MKRFSYGLNVDPYETIIYSGSWNSTVVSSVYGKSYVRLPKDINLLTENKGESYKTTLYIDYLGWYRSGERVIIPVTVESNNKSLTVGTISNYGFKMTSEQKLTFTTTHITTETISGTYTSANPIDSGVFILSPSNFSEIPRIDSVSNCVIL